MNGQCCPRSWPIAPRPTSNNASSSFYLSVARFVRVLGDAPVERAYRAYMMAFVRFIGIATMPSMPYSLLCSMSGQLTPIGPRKLTKSGRADPHRCRCWRGSGITEYLRNGRSQGLSGPGHAPRLTQSDRASP